jgi:hypothetical protein
MHNPGTKVPGYFPRVPLGRKMAKLQSSPFQREIVLDRRFFEFAVKVWHAWLGPICLAGKNQMAALRHPALLERNFLLA